MTFQACRHDTLDLIWGVGGKIQLRSACLTWPWLYLRLGLLLLLLFFTYVFPAFLCDIHCKSVDFVPVPCAPGYISLVDNAEKLIFKSEGDREYFRTIEASPRCRDDTRLNACCGLSPNYFDTRGPRPFFLRTSLEIDSFSVLPRLSIFQ